MKTYIHGKDEGRLFHLTFCTGEKRGRCFYQGFAGITVFSRYKHVAVYLFLEIILPFSRAFVMVEARKNF